MVKYSFVMGYYKRPVQFHNSLISFRHHYSKRDDYEIVLVVDIKNDEQDLIWVKEVMTFFSDIPIRFSIFDAPGAETDLNHARILNEGVKRASGDYIIITMPEMFHTVDILGGFDKIYSEKPEAYIVCTVGAYQDGSPLIEKYEDFQYRVNAWYQHPRFRNKIIYFTACMKKTFFWDLGGVYEKYASGIGHEDTSFRFRVFDSGVEIITPEELLIIHQAHESTGQLFGQQRDADLTARNLKMAREEIPAAWFSNQHTPSNWWRNQKLKEKEK